MMNDDQYRWLVATVGAILRPDADAAYIRLGTPRDVAVEVLTARRAEWLESAVQVTIPGAVSVNYTENIRAVERLIVSLREGPADPTDVPAAGGGGAVLMPVQTESAWARGRRPRHGTFYPFG